MVCCVWLPAAGARALQVLASPCAQPLQPVAVAVADVLRLQHYGVAL